MIILSPEVCDDGSQMWSSIMTNLHLNQITSEINGGGALYGNAGALLLWVWVWILLSWVLGLLSAAGLEINDIDLFEINEV